MLNLFTYLEKGGLIMWPLLLCSIFTIAVTIERILYYRTHASGNIFVQKYTQLLAQGNLQEAAQLAQNSTGEAAKLMVDASDIAIGHNHLQNFLEMRAGIIMAKFREKLNYLSIIVTLAPLLGLLGTIIGMISAFNIFHLKAGEPMAITGGIGEALIATATGLCVAIIALCCHAYLAHRLDKVITDLELCCSALTEAKSRGDR